MSEILFFDPRDEKYGFLSNFYRASFQLDGFEWSTAEHYYQAQKFENAAYCECIRLAATPKEAKNLGQTRALPVRKDWETHRMTAMLQALVAKFTQNTDLQTMLLAIDNEDILVEASPQDNFWGNGADGRGENRLGYLLTTLHRHLRRFLANDNSSLKSPDELAKLCFESVRRMHGTWWLPDSLRLETQTSVLPEELNIYVRDVDLPDGYVERYRIGLIFREPTFCDASEHSKQGLAAKHRYFLLSGNAKHVDALFGGKSGSPGTGLSIFQTDTLWKVLAVNQTEGHAQITLLEIPPLALHAFSSQALTVLEQGLADQAAERFAQALQLPELDACKGAEWLARLRHPLGIRDDGVFLECWLNGRHEQALKVDTSQADEQTEFSKSDAPARALLESENLQSSALAASSTPQAEKPHKHRLKRALGLFIMLLGAYIGFVVAQTDPRPASVIVFAGVIVLFGALVIWQPDSMN